MGEMKNITSEQKALVQSSFQLLMPVGEKVMAFFYKRLFELDPGLRPMFKISMAEQERKFIDMLRVVVYGLDYPQQLFLTIHRLGERHRAYGVKPQDYHTMRVALIWALEQGLESNFSAEMQEAWQATYNMLVDLMS
jgi:hemoglobin-like flavoprotein